MAAQTTQNSAYFDQIRTLCNAGFPHLQRLRDFKDLYQEPTRAKCTLLDFREPQRPPTVHQPAYNEQLALLQSLERRRGTSRSLLIVESLTSELVEQIGSAWKIDPHFFGSYLVTPDWEPADKYTSAVRLPSAQKSDNFVCLNYLDLIKLPKDYQHIGRYEVCSNVNRNIEIRRLYGNGENDNVSQVVGLVSRKVALWARRYDNGCSEAVLLCDPGSDVHGLFINVPTDGTKDLQLVSATDWSPWAGGCVNITPWDEVTVPSLNAVFSKSQRLAFADAIQYYWSQSWLYQQDADALVRTHLLIQKLIQSRWLLTTTYLREDFNSLELQSLARDGTSIFVLGSVLDKLMSSRNLLIKCSWLLKRSLQELGVNPTDDMYHAKRQDLFGSLSSVNPGPLPPSGFLSLNAVSMDWTFILKELEAWQSDTSDLLNTHMINLQFLDSNRALDDSRVSRYESHNVNRLTYIAAIFVPLSFTSGLLSMGSDFIPGGAGKFWVFWAVGLSLCAGLFILIFCTQLHDRWRENKGKERQELKAQTRSRRTRTERVSPSAPRRMHRTFGSGANKFTNLLVAPLGPSAGSMASQQGLAMHEAPVMYWQPAQSAAADPIQ